MSQKLHRTLVGSAFLLALLLCVSANAQIETADLTQTLSSQLGISGEQAAGGAGAMFEYAQKNLDAEDFAIIAQGIPAMDQLLEMAPEPENTTGVGEAGSMLNGVDTPVGGVAGVAASFESLGLDAGMVSEFLPIVSDYVGSMSGDKAKDLLMGLF